MLRRLSFKSCTLPTLYVASTAADIVVAKENGLPYIVWKRSDEELVKCVFYPWLKEKFPYLKMTPPATMRELKVSVPMPREWTPEKSDKQPGYVAPDEDILSNGYNERLPCGNTVYEESNESSYEEIDLADYVATSKMTVDITELEELNLLPAFIGEVATNIKRNLVNQKWTEGYNKKRQCAIGNMNASKELPNLILIDVSASIPAGVSATMISLADTLRHQCNAELIIHSDYAQWWDLNEELPDPRMIRNMFGYCNESDEFDKVLNQHILGREFGHVIAFGDHDAYSLVLRQHRSEMTLLHSTKVHHLHSYFVPCLGDRGRCGFVNWIEDVDDESININWVKSINKR